MSKKAFFVVVICLLTLPLRAQPLPLAQYTFNSGTAVDDTGNGFDGILLDSAAVVNDAERGLVMQLNQGSMRMDGPFPITTSFTLSAWIKVQLPPSGRNFFNGAWHIRTDRQDDPDQRDWIDFRYPDSTSVDKWNPKSAENPLGFLDGQWHHYIFVLDSSGDNYVYFDGVLLPRRDDKVKAHDFGGAVGPILAGGDGIDGCMDDIRIFDYVVPEEEFDQLMAESALELARNPVPKDGATDVIRTVTLTWESSGVAATQDVYIGTEFADVNEASRLDDRGVLASQGQTGSSYTPSNLKLGDKIYWRIDSVEVDGTIHKGGIWSFTMEPYAYPVDNNNITATASSAEPGMVAQNTVNGSGLDPNDSHSTVPDDMWLTSGVKPDWIHYEFDKIYKLDSMWVWNSNQQTEGFIGFGAKDVTIEYSTDGATWTVLEGVPEFAQAPGAGTYTANTVVDFGGVVATFVKLTIDSNWMGIVPQTGLSEVRFFHLPVRAREPQPADGATVDPIVVLSWRAGRETATHEVYLGTDPNVLPLIDTTIEPQYDTSGMDMPLGQTYYWRIDEVNGANIWEGDIWQFTTRAYREVDDFENYGRDDDNNPLWMTWYDGFAASSDGLSVVNGSVAGALTPPYVDTATKYDGSQSMPMHFNNTGQFAYNFTPTTTFSEVSREITQEKDWTAGSASTLFIAWRGDSYTEETIIEQGKVIPTETDILYVGIEDGTDQQEFVNWEGPVTDLTQTDSWHEWTIPLTEFAGVDITNITKLYIGVGNRDNPSVGGRGVVWIDAIRLYTNESSF